MVQLVKALLRIPNEQLGKHMKRQFIDKLRVYVKSGNGGRGFSKLGGVGGNGGNVICVAKENLSLKDVYSRNLKKRYIAGNGEDSR
jgi:GTPase involved in cell partitioning and DNA repair